VRADVVPGQPQWIHNKHLPGGLPAPGGKYLNYLAFTDPVCGMGAICTTEGSISNVVEGDLRRNLLRGFGLAQLDLGVQRRFPITESAGFQFRAELFNITNHPNFSNPTASITSGTIGTTTGDVAPPTSIYGSGQGGLVSGRNVVLTGKFMF